MAGNGSLPWNDSQGSFNADYQPEWQDVYDELFGELVSAPPIQQTPPLIQQQPTVKRTYPFGEKVDRTKGRRKVSDDTPFFPPPIPPNSSRAFPPEILELDDEILTPPLPFEGPPTPIPQSPSPQFEPPPPEDIPFMDADSAQKDELAFLGSLTKKVFDPWANNLTSPFTWWEALIDFIHVDPENFRTTVVKEKYLRLLKVAKEIRQKVTQDYPFIFDKFRVVVNSQVARNGITSLIRTFTLAPYNNAQGRASAERALYIGYGIAQPIVPSIPIPTGPPYGYGRGNAQSAAARGGANPPTSSTGRGRGAASPPPTGGGRGRGRPPIDRASPPPTRPIPQEGDRNFDLPDALNDINDPCYASLKKALFKGNFLFFFLKKNGFYFKTAIRQWRVGRWNIFFK